jgi:lipoprotein-anchoring transpeptidase ErfK/SrfK
MMGRRLVMCLAIIPIMASFPVVYGAKAKTVQRKKGKADRVKTKRPVPTSLDVAAVNSPLTQDVVRPNATGSAVVRAQILLDRAHFSPGEIDGHYGDNLRSAIEGFQAARKLPVNGVVDQPVWQAVNADLSAPLVPYTINTVDAAGPYETVPPGMMEQSQLKSLGYQSPLEALGERFHIAPKLLQDLNPGKDFAKAGEEIMVPNVQRAYGVVKADRLVVSKGKRTVSVFAADNTVIRQYPATIGSEHDPLPIGEWKITTVRQNPKFYYNPDLFWNADAKDSKATIPAGPNNPVGVVWIGLSKEHYGIHGTPEPGTIGHTESHGCIRLANWDAEELSQMVKPGTPAVLEE